MTFGVPLSYFFDDMPPLEEGDMAGLRGGVQEPSAPVPMDRRETPEPVRAYDRIANPKARDAPRYTVSSLAKGAGSRSARDTASALA